MLDFKTLDGVSYSYIKSDRFKTTLISVGFYLPLADIASANALTLNLMKSGTVKLSDTYSLNRKLASLYGASVTSSAAKLGDCQELRLDITVNDDRFAINGEHTVDEAGNLLCDMIFSHLLAGSVYSDEAINREKRLLCETIAGKLNDKRTYSRNRCEEIMCEGEPYGISGEGTVDAVKELTASDVKQSLDRIVRTSFISIQVIGADEPKAFVNTFAECIEKAGRDYKGLPTDTVKSAGETRTVEEKMPVNQGKLVLGLRSAVGGEDRETVAAWVMCDVFGGGPYSKLFCNVREKMSLCYYCSARSVRRKGLILVDCGVEDANIEAAKEAILAQLQEVASGNIAEKEINSSKLALCDAIRSVESDQATLSRWYATRALEVDPASPEEMCELISKVTVEDCKQAASLFKLDTVFVLRPDGTVKEGQ